MTTDLGSLFRAGQAASGSWSEEEVWQALEALISPGSRIDWEPGDEEWGRILDAMGTVTALVCARVPVSFVREDVDAERMPDRVSWLRFKSTEDPIYRVDRGLLEQIFGEPPSDKVDFGKLSLDDLWYATVT